MAVRWRNGTGGLTQHHTDQITSGPEEVFWVMSGLRCGLTRVSFCKLYLSVLRASGHELHHTLQVVRVGGGLFIMQSVWTGRLSGSSSCYNQSYNSGCRCFCVQLKTPQSRRLARTAVKLLWSRRTAALASLCPLCAHMNVGSAFSSRSVTASFKQPPCVFLFRWSCGSVVNSASRSCPSRRRCFYFAAVRPNMQQIQQADGRVIIFCFISEEHAAGRSCFFICQKELCFSSFYLLKLTRINWEETADRPAARRILLFTHCYCDCSIFILKREVNMTFLSHFPR